jgi:hypothetical protein
MFHWLFVGGNTFKVVLCFTISALSLSLIQVPLIKWLLFLISPMDDDKKGLASVTKDITQQGDPHTWCVRYDPGNPLVVQSVC